jgi:predicted GH43/DUF377 family glycosyl hydrolase
MNNNVVIRRKCILAPVEGCPFASEMVLNPAIVRDPDTGRIHMLVRVSGPMPEKRLEGKPMPFPIYFAYGWSDDRGESFEFDLTVPALSPAVEYEEEKLWITDGRGNRVPNYVNGCIEDPRLFFIEGECYVAVAGRTFPAGPYWIHDEPVQCMPEWALSEDSPIGNRGNVTTTVLYKVDLNALSRRDYDNAFKYVTDLTDPAMCEDRDVFIFPEKMKIDGKMQYVMIHRPHHPDAYEGIEESRPAIVIAAAEDLYSFAKGPAKRRVLYAPELDWQGDKVGGSTPPISMGNGEWLFNFHARKNEAEGYAQSFMILRETENDFPEISHLYPHPWIVPEADFEQPHKFPIPCIFFTGIAKLGDRLLVSYGAADENAAVMELDYNAIVSELEKYPYAN